MFAQVDIEVPDALYEKFSEMPPQFVVQEILHRDIPEEMKIYKEKTSPWKKTKGLSYIHQEAFVTYVEINEKSSSTVVAMVPWGVVVIVRNVSQICKP